jgi:hypothetical protein
VSLPANTEDRYGIGPMLVDAFSELGFHSGLVHDGDPKVIKADILLMLGIGSCYSYAGYSRLLSGHEQSKLTAILWHFEPLPPPGLTERAERIGTNLVKYNWNKLSKPYRRLVRIVPGNRHVRNAIQRMLVWAFKKEMHECAGQDYRNLHHRQLCYAMEHYLWFKERYSPSWCDYVFVSTPPKGGVLKSIGIQTHYMPIGYHKSWGHRLVTERDIDVLFIGRVKKTPREYLIRSLRGELASKGIKLVIIDKNNACYGEQRAKLLNRARIVLDVVKIPWELPVMRLLMCIGCGALVVSNWTGDATPFRKEHFVQVKTDALVNAIFYFLRHEDERKKIVNAAYEFVTQELNLTRTVSRILEISGLQRITRVQNLKAV